MINLLILNVGTRNKVVQYFVKEMKNIGKVVVTDSYALAPALYEADKYYITKWCEEEGYIDELIVIIKKEQIGGLLSLLDPDLPVVATHKEVFEKMGVKCFISSYDTIIKTFNKYFTYTILKNNGISCAKTYQTLEAFDISYNKREIQFPVFCKPICGSGSIGIEKVYNYNRLKEIMEQHHNYIIQEFLVGQEIGADLYVDLYSGNLSTIFTKKKLKMRSGETDKSVSFIDEVLFENLRKMSKLFEFYGPIDVDIFEVKGKYFISEINPRLGGGYLHAYGCGVNIPEMIVNNLQGIYNKENVGNYEENVYMMKYFDVMIRKMED